METKTLTKELIPQVRQYAESVLSQLPPSLTYHNVDHTRLVAQMAEKIGVATGLSDHALENVIVAAWLHDVGHLGGCVNHEDRSKSMARTVLEDLDVSEKRIEKILDCIEATKMPQQPRSDKEMVLCDADLFHLSTPEFMISSENLRQEINAAQEKISLKKWLKKTIQLMEQHRYFTAYAQENFEPGKQQNLYNLRERLSQLKADDKKAQFETPSSPSPSQSKADAPLKDKRAERGIETMFRTTSTNHLQLSAMADNKANIMISVNAIIISLVLSVLVRKLEEWPELVVPTVLLTIVCLLTTVFAILAVRPTITSGRFSKEDIEHKKGNLLFFGNFYQMDLPEYEWGMREMMNDADFLYASMTRDIFYLGKVLGRKYKFLRLSYTVFMFGFVLSVISFGIAAAISK